MSPPVKEVLETERLRLIHMTDTSLSGDHVKWLHATWSDPIATSWSLYGTCNTLEETQAGFIEQLDKYDLIAYTVFSRFSADGAELPFPGEVVGNVGLRTSAKGVELPPFPRASLAPASDQKPTDPATPPLSDHGVLLPAQGVGEGVWDRGWAGGARGVSGGDEGGEGEGKRGLLCGGYLVAV
jgi:hypothetical protein